MQHDYNIDSKGEYSTILIIILTYLPTEFVFQYAVP